MSESTAITKILDLARWAPSGDNTQPWRFELTGDSGFSIHGSDTRAWCVYDLEGHASQLAIGALWESIVIAASTEGMEARIGHHRDSTDQHPILEVDLLPKVGLAVDPLAAFLGSRVTQRRPFSRRPLDEAHRQRLTAALQRLASSEGRAGMFRVLWVEGGGKKLQMARLLFRNAGIRLTIKEAFEVHRRVIEWDSSESIDKIPDRAVGLNSLALTAMKLAMEDWDRVKFANRYLAGTLLPRLEMDILPALGCAAHFLIIAERVPTTIDDFLAAGRAVQRFWLTASSLGLQFQPETTPMIFSRYVRDDVRFSEDTAAIHKAETLKGDFEDLVGVDNLARAVFVGRVGYGRPPKARSIRRPLSALFLPDH